MVATTLASLALIAGVLVFAPGSPAPRLTDNVAINQKAKWLRRNLADHRCDVVVLGSSIALNAFDAESLHRRWPEASPAGGPVKIVNVGWWGMSPPDAHAMMTMLLDLCSPKIVVMPSFYGDYMSTTRGLDWPLLSDYIRSASLVSAITAYVRNMDMLYYVQHAVQASSRPYFERQEYASLAFDASGGVGLACEGFRISKARWEGWRTVSRPPEAYPEALRAMAALAALSRQHGILFIVAATPMRSEAEQGLFPAAVDAVWRAVAAAIAPDGGLFTRPIAAGMYDDTMFADFAHLNSCGAAHWTQTVLTEFEGRITSRLAQR